MIARQGHAVAVAIPVFRSRSNVALNNPLRPSLEKSRHTRCKWKTWGVEN